MVAKLPQLRPVKHKRYHHRRAMTIAIGFHLSDGVVLCSDRQVTAGDEKSNTNKTDLWLDPDPSREGWNRGSLAITGA